MFQGMPAVSGGKNAQIKKCPHGHQFPAENHQEASSLQADEQRRMGPHLQLPSLSLQEDLVC